MRRSLRIALLAVVFVGVIFVDLRARAAEPTTINVIVPDQVTVDGQPVALRPVKIAVGDDKRRSLEMDDVQHTADIFDTAYFGNFDLKAGKSAPAQVVIHSMVDVSKAKILPTALAIIPVVSGRDITFSVSQPANLTIEINGDPIHSLHLFANPPAAAPDPHDPNVIYFGPGVHELPDGIRVDANHTVYLADGAVVKGVGLARSAIIRLEGDHISVRGRGIIDGGDCPTHSRSLITVHGSDIQLEGVTLTDSPTWNIPIRQSDHVLVDRVKIFGHRSNSDGIDICNSTNVTVSNCFLRTLDDLIVIKSDRQQGPVHHVVVKNCVLWNQVAHALSIGAELCEPVDDVLFTDCDVIHDLGREYTLRIYNCDSAIVQNVRFENLRIEEARKLISLWIGKAKWSRDAERGHIADVSFDHINAVGTPLSVDLVGANDADRVVGATFQDVSLNGKPLTTEQIHRNAFVNGVQIKPTTQKSE